MFDRIRTRIVRGLAVLALLPAAGAALAQVPNASSGVPAESFLGEQFCFVTNLTNVGAPGYGPYLRLVIPPQLSFDSAEIFDSPLAVVSNQLFPVSGQLVDPLIRAPTSNVVTGTQGDRLVILRLPVGSITQGGPPLESEICLTIQPSAIVGTPLDVEVTPVYQFGNTPTGANGSIVGPTPPQTVTPTVVRFEKTNDAPEAERPPGPAWPYDYILTVDIANTAVINPLVISDALPADVQFVGPVTITGGTGCSTTQTPSPGTPGGDVVVTCNGNTTGTTSDTDVVVSFPVHVIDTLEENVCNTELLLNDALVAPTYVNQANVPIPLSPLQDASEVTAKNVALQKSVSPAGGDPGTVVTYTLQFQTTEYGTTSALTVRDVLPDGIDFTADGTLTVNGSPVAIDPVVTLGVNDTLDYDIRAAYGQDFAPATAITLTFTGTVDQLYEGTNLPVLAADDLTNTATVTYSLAEGAAACTDGTAATFIVEPVDIVKRVLSTGPYMPGDTVTYRLTMNIPSGDTQNVVFRDFFPLPVFDVDTLDLTWNGPDIRRAVGGPGADTMNLVPAISIDPATNQLILNYPNVNTTSPQTVAVDIDIDVLPNAFADDLFLTNIFRASSANTGLIEANENAPVQIQVFSPDLDLTKGVLSTNGNGTPNPGTGSPIDSNLTGADAQDTVVFRITIENTGGAPAYDVVVTDPLPAGFSACSVVNTQLATGAALTSTGALATGLTLINGSAATAVLAADDGAPNAGADTAWVDVSCTVAAGVPTALVLVNEARATWKPQPAGTPDVQTFPPVSDQASVTIANYAIAKSIVATSEPHTTGTNVAIGEIVRYRLAVRVPEGITTGMNVVDVLPANLRYMNDNSVRMAFVASPGAAMSASNSPGTPTVIGNDPAVATSPLATAFGGPVSGATCSGNTPPTGNGDDVCFQLGNVSNGGNDGDAEYVVIEFNALVLNVGANEGQLPGQTAIANTAEVRSANAPTVASNAVGATVVEPRLVIDKTASPATADAGDVVSYTILLTNPAAQATATAFDITVSDPIDSRLVLGTVQPPVIAGGAVNVVPVNTATSVGFTVGALPPGASVSVTFSATLTNAVQPGTSVPNTASYAGSSLPGGGTPAGSPGNDTLSGTPGTGGDQNGERNAGTGYVGNDAAPVVVPGVTLTKTLVSSSSALTGQTRVRPAVEDLAIGEIATFDIVATIPEGTTPQVVIRDTMPYTNGVMEMLGATSVTVSAGLTTQFNPGVGTLPTDAQLADGINDTLVLDFGQVINPPSAAPARTITVQVQGRLRNVAANANTDQLTNSATVQYGTGLNATATAPVDVVEPLLDIQKSSAVTTGQAGDVVPFTLTIRHTAASNSHARQVTIQDTLPTPAGLDGLVVTNTSSTGTCSAIDTSASTGTQLNVAIAQMNLDCVVTIEYSATLQPDVQVGSTVTNTANLGWRSFSDGEPEGPFARSYTDADNHVVQISSPGLVKTVVSTSAPSTGVGQIDPLLDDLTVGETVTYQFSVVLPSGVSPNAVAVDQLPISTVSMAVVSSRIVTVGSQITPAPVPGTAGVAVDSGEGDGLADRVTWSLGTLTAATGAPVANRTLVFEVVARIADTDPTTRGGVTVRNTATFDTDTTAPISGSADIDIVEPRLVLAKSITSPSAPVIVQAGQVISYELVLSHATGAPAVASGSDAFDIVVRDTLPNPGVSFNAGSVGGTCAGVTTSAAAYPLVTFSLPSLPLATASCTITYTGTVTNTVQPSVTYANSAVADYTSLPGSVATERTSTTNTATDDFTILGPSLVKVTTTSDLTSTTSAVGDPLLFDLAIGETVTYTLTIGFPEGTVGNAVLVDALPTGAAGVLEVIGANVQTLGHVGIVTSLPGTPAFSDSDGDLRNDTTTFDFGTISNPANGDLTDDYIIVQVIARVADEAVNADGIELTNNARFTTSTTTPVVDDASIEVVEPELGITKTMGPVVDGVVTISVTLANTGNSAAHGIVIDDVLDDAIWDLDTITPTSVPTGFLFTTVDAGSTTTVRLATDPSAVLPDGSVPAGGSITLTFTVALDSVPPSVNPVPNTATNTGAISHPGSPNPDAREYDDVSDDALLGLPAPVVRKTANVAGTTPGGTVVFQIIVDNSAGDAALTNVVIDDVVPANTTFDALASDAGWTGCADGAPAGTACSIGIASVPAGGSAAVLFAVTVDDPLPAGVTLVANQALVDGDELIDPIPSDDPTPPGPDDPTEVPVTASPLLTIDKVDDVADGSDTVPGATLVYTLTYENTGNQAATGVFLTETVPANTTYDAAASAPHAWSCAPDNSAGSTCTLAIGNLAVGVPGTALFAVVLDNPVPAGVVQIANTAVITDDRDNTDDDGETTPLDADPGLHIVKSDGGTSTAPGGTVAYALQYFNDGDQNATGVVVTETVPLHTTFNAAASSAGWSCANGAPAGTTCTLAVGTLAGGQSLATAQSATFAVTVVANLPAGVTQIANTARITDAEDGLDEASDDTPVTAAPDLTLAKDDAGATTAPGGTVTWTLSYANVGNQDATGVVITETVPANTTFDGNGAWTCVPDANAGSTCTFTVGALAAGATGNVTFGVVVDAAMPAGAETLVNGASIADDGSNGPDPTPGDNADEDDTPVTALPALEVEKDDGGATAVAGGTITWTLTYRNVGNQAAAGVTLTDTVPANTTFSAAASGATVWTCADGAAAGTVCSTNVGTVAAGAPDAAVQFGVTVDTPLPAGVELVANTVLIASDGTGGEGTDPQDQASDDTPLTAAPDLTVAKTDGDATAVAGDVVEYVLSVQNVGTQDATGVVLTETVPLHTSFVAGQSDAGWQCAAVTAGSTCTLAIGNLAAGAPPVDFVFAVQIDAVLPDSVKAIDNATSVADDGSNGPDPTPADNTAGDFTPVTAGPDLTLAKSDGGTTTSAGGIVDYVLTYANVGTQDAVGVTITETVPANTTFNAATSSGTWSCPTASPAGTQCVIQVGTVAAGAPPAELTFSVRVVDVLPAGVETVANSAVIADDGSNGEDPTPEDNTAGDDTPVDAAPDLSIVKTDNDATATAGGSITWTLSYANNGDQDASGVVLSETVPANTRFSTAGSSAGWSCADDAPAGSTCTLVVGNVAAAGTGSATFAVDVLDPLPAGVELVANTATVGDDGTGGTDPTPEDNSDGDDTPVTAAPDLVVTKTAVQDVGAAGEVLVYTLTYSNVGTQDATGVVLTETVPANSTYDSAGSAAGWSCANGAAAGSTCTLAIGAVAADAPAQSVQFAVRVDSPLPADVATILNTVTIADDGDNGPDPTPENNTGSDETPLSAAPDLRLEKVADVEVIEPGQPVVYTLTYRNTGVRDATGAVITETVPAGTVFVAAGSTAGWSCADGAAAGTTCELAVGDVAADAAPASVTFVVRVLDDAEDAVANVASIADDGAGGPDPTPDNNIGDVSTPIDGLPDPVPQPNVVPAMDDLARLLLLLAMLSIGLLAVRSRR